MPHRLAHAAQRRINHLIRQTGFFIFGTLIGVPLTYQLALIVAPRSLFYTVTALRAYEATESDPTLYVEIRRRLPFGPMPVHVTWEINDAQTNKNLCTRSAHIVLEGPRATLTLERLGGCDPITLAGRRVVIQGHFVKTLDFGIRKEQLVWSPEFDVPTTWRTGP